MSSTDGRNRSGRSSTHNGRQRMSGFARSDYIGYRGGQSRYFGNGSATVPQRKRITTMTKGMKRNTMKMMKKKTIKMTKKGKNYYRSVCIPK
jgi:hypothetical protein